MEWFRDLITSLNREPKRRRQVRRSSIVPPFYETLEERIVLDASIPTLVAGVTYTYSGLDFLGFSNGTYGYGWNSSAITGADGNDTLQAGIVISPALFSVGSGNNYPIGKPLSDALGDLKLPKDMYGPNGVDIKKVSGIDGLYAGPKAIAIDLQRLDRSITNLDRANEASKGMLQAAQKDYDSVLPSLPSIGLLPTLVSTDSFNHYLGNSPNYAKVKGLITTAADARTKAQTDAEAAGLAASAADDLSALYERDGKMGSIAGQYDRVNLFGALIAQRASQTDLLRQKTAELKATVELYNLLKEVYVEYQHSIGGTGTTDTNGNSTSVISFPRSADLISPAALKVGAAIANARVAERGAAGDAASIEADRAWINSELKKSNVNQKGVQEKLDHIAGNEASRLDRLSKASDARAAVPQTIPGNLFSGAFDNYGKIKLLQSKAAQLTAAAAGDQQAIDQDQAFINAERARSNPNQSAISDRQKHIQANLASKAQRLTQAQQLQSQADAAWDKGNSQLVQFVKSWTTVDAGSLVDVAEKTATVMDGFKQLADRYAEPLTEVFDSKSFRDFYLKVRGGQSLIGLSQLQSYEKDIDIALEKLHLARFAKSAGATLESTGKLLSKVTIVLQVVDFLVNQNNLLDEIYTSRGTPQFADKVNAFVKNLFVTGIGMGGMELGGAGGAALGAVAGGGAADVVTIPAFAIGGSMVGKHLAEQGSAAAYDAWVAPLVKSLATQNQSQLEQASISVHNATTDARNALGLIGH